MLTDCFRHKLVPELDPKLLKVLLKVCYQKWVVRDDQIFLIGAHSLGGPVEAARDEDRTVDNTVFVVHVCNLVVVSGRRHALETQPPHICTVELSALIIADQTAFDPFLVAVKNRISQYVISEGKNTDLESLASTADDLSQLLYVCLMRKEHSKVVGGLGLMVLL